MGDATWQEERRKALAEVLELVDGLEYEKAGRMADATLSTYDLMIALGDLRRETADAERLRSELASEREARETEVASLKRELAAAQALLIKANDICAVVAEGRDVDDDIGGIWLDTSCDITEDANHICDEIESYGTSAIDSYVADATADLRHLLSLIIDRLEGMDEKLPGIDDGATDQEWIKALNSLLGEYEKAGYDEGERVGERLAARTALEAAFILMDGWAKHLGREDCVNAVKAAVSRPAVWRSAREMVTDPDVDEVLSTKEEDGPQLDRVTVSGASREDG